MARIRITPEQVDGVSREFKNGSAQSQELISRLTSQVESMQSEWEGMTQQRFYQQFSQAKQGMTQFVQLLEQISQELDSISQRFRQVDGQ